jgi:hypothetical protein
MHSTSQLPLLLLLLIGLFRHRTRFRLNVDFGAGFSLFLSCYLGRVLVSVFLLLVVLAARKLCLSYLSFFLIGFSCLSFSLQGTSVYRISLSSLSVFVRGIVDGSLSCFSLSLSCLSCSLQENSPSLFSNHCVDPRSDNDLGESLIDSRLGDVLGK